MILHLCRAALADTIALLKEQENFFQLDKGQKEEKVASFPGALRQYLTEGSEDSFHDDLKKAVQFLVSPDLYDGEKGGFIEAVASYLSGDFTQIVDRFDKDFYLSNLADRKQKVAEVIQGSSLFMKELAELFAMESAQDINQAVSDFLRMVKEVPVILVQSPQECDSGLKADIRSHFQEKDPHSFVEFYSNPQIIGGVRVFINGHMQDYSWLGKVERLTQAIH